MDLQRNVVSDTTRVMQNFLALRDIHIIPLRLSRTEDLVSKICCCKMSTFGRPSLPLPFSHSTNMGHRFSHPPHKLYPATH